MWGEGRRVRVGKNSELAHTGTALFVGCGLGLPCWPNAYTCPGLSFTLSLWCELSLEPAAEGITSMHCHPGSQVAHNNNILSGEFILGLLIATATLLQITTDILLAKRQCGPKNSRSVLVTAFLPSNHSMMPDILPYTMGLKRQSSWHLLTCYLFLHNSQLVTQVVIHLH